MPISSKKCLASSATNNNNLPELINPVDILSAKNTPTRRRSIRTKTNPVYFEDFNVDVNHNKCTAKRDIKGMFS